MIWAAFFSAIATSLGSLILWKTLGPEGSLKKERDLRRRIVGSHSPENLDAPATLEKTYRLSDIKTFENFLSPHESSKRVANLLKRAQLKITVSVFFLSCLILGVLPFVGTLVYVGPFYSAVLAAGVTSVPFLYLRFRNKQYLLKFAEYLSEALSIMSGAIKTGLGLEAAVEAAAKNTPYPVSMEFQAVVSEMRLGQPLQTALQNVYQRIKSPEMKIFVTGIAIQQELGGNLSEILDNLQKTIRDRFALQREIKVLSAQGVLSSRILLTMPYVLLLLLLTMNPSMVTEFFASQAGQLTLYVILGLQFIAFLWMRRIVQLKE